MMSINILSIAIIKFLHMNQISEYMNIAEDLQIEGGLFVAGLVFHTSGISELLHIIILKPSYSFKRLC